MKPDVAIVGGGIAGLWALNRLRSLGYDAHLYEKTALGHGQTIASQGIIHGGLKYALDGFVHPQRETLAAMPARWRECLRGNGEIDLRGVVVLAEKQELRFQNKLFGFAAQMGVSGEIEVIKTGTHFRLNEPVLDMKSLLGALAYPMRDYIYRADQPTGRHRAKCTIHTAGVGNVDYCSLKQIQLRSLRMFMVKPMNRMIYVHEVGSSHRPRVTITSHRINGEIVWYMGGAIAEAQRPIDEAKADLANIMPDEDFTGKQWSFHDVIRSEPITEDGRLPKRPSFVSMGNLCTAWPVKLAMAPILADELVRWVQSRGILPSGLKTVQNHPQAFIAALPWETSAWTN